MPACAVTRLPAAGAGDDLELIARVDSDAQRVGARHRCSAHADLGQVAIAVVIGAERISASCACINVTSASVRLARSRWLSNDGQATLDNTPAMATAIIVSISVKPRWRRRGAAAVAMLGWGNGSFITVSSGVVGISRRASPAPLRQASTSGRGP